MPRSRVEIQEALNANRMGLENNELILNDSTLLNMTGMSYSEIKNGRDKFASQVIDCEKELAEAKTRGEKGRALDKIREEISKAQTAVNHYRLMENSAQMHSSQWANGRFAANLQQCSLNALQQELNEAIEEEKKAEIDKIKQSYEQEIRSNPNKAEVYITRGINFMSRGMADVENRIFLDQAIADFTQAIKINPNAKDAYFNRAELYSINNDFDRAIADYNQMIRIDPDNALAYTFRGGVYLQQGKHDQALSDLNEAIRVNPKISNAYMFRGLIYFNKEVQSKEDADYDNAVAYIDKAIAETEEALRIDSNSTAANLLIKDVRNEKPIVERMRRERQEQYDKLVQKTNNASTENEFQDLTQQLREMRGFKDTTELANKCENKYQELKKERELKEKKRNLTGLLIQLGITLVFPCVLLLLFYVLEKVFKLSFENININSGLIVIILLAFYLIISFVSGFISLIFRRDNGSVFPWGAGFIILGLAVLCVVGSVTDTSEYRGGLIGSIISALIPAVALICIFKVGFNNAFSIGKYIKPIIIFIIAGFIMGTILAANHIDMSMFIFILGIIPALPGMIMISKVESKG